MEDDIYDPNRRNHDKEQEKINSTYFYRDFVNSLDV